jgi:cytochrome c-type biogenesis protein
MLASLFAGLLASMWPCLLQLSAYFLPSVAGLSLAEADRGVRRAPVLRTAVLFVSGIVVVYTFAGAAAGFAAQSLSATSLFDDLRGPITFVAGLVVLAMAARLAVQARAPLVCKMPVLNMAGRFGHGPLGTVALGLAFATGCMTCFGAALVLGMFTYVVTTASPLTGALILFLFSLGIAVPLVVAAVAMARILPLLGHLERNARYLSLASAGIMALYGVLLLTGSTHVISDAVASLGGLR